MVERISQAITGDKSITVTIQDHTLKFSGTFTEAKFLFITGASEKTMVNSEAQPSNKYPYEGLLVMTREACIEDLKICF